MTLILLGRKHSTGRVKQQYWFCTACKGTKATCISLEGADTSSNTALSSVMLQRYCHCRWKQGRNQTKQIRHCHTLCVVSQVLGMSGTSSSILKVTLFQLWVAWMVISRASTMLWGTWLMRSSSSWLMITSCLTSQFLLFCWHLGWQEIGLMPGVSGEYAWEGGVVQSPCKKKSLAVLVVAHTAGNGSFWTRITEINEKLVWYPLGKLHLNQQDLEKCCAPRGAGRNKPAWLVCSQSLPAQAGEAPDNNWISLWKQITSKAVDVLLHSALVSGD